MKSSAPYTRVTLRGSRRGRGHNSTSAPPSREVTTNAKRLHPPSPQPADIPSAIYLFNLFTLQPFIGYSVSPNRVTSPASA